MTKNLKPKAIIAIILCAVLILSACTPKLRGKYVSVDSESQTFNFVDDKTVIISSFGIGAEGTYKIEDGKIVITYSLLGLSYDFVKDFEKKGKSIFIDGEEFVKE